MQEAREMLRKWEAHDAETVKLWKMMNDWVYAGFDETYRMLGVSFDKIYYESETYLAGKEEVLRGLREGLFYQKRTAQSGPISHLTDSITNCCSAPTELRSI